MKIAVIRFSSLGDCTLLCPFLAHLKEFGASEVTVVTKRAFAGLFAGATAVDRVVALDDGAGWRGLLQIIRLLRDGEYLVIDAHNNPRSRAISMGVGGAVSRLRKYYRERLGLILFKRPVEVPTMAQRYSALGEPLGLPSVPVKTGGIEVPDTIRQRMRERLGTQRGVVVSIAPGSRWPMKRWGVEKFVELAANIRHRHDARIVLLGDGRDTALTGKLAASLGERVVDLAGRTSILETAAAIAETDVFVGNDSGLMHLAEAVGVPVVALFGPTVRAFGYYPALEASRVIERGIPCRPCSRNGSRDCPKGTQECLTGIAVEPVETAFDEVLLGRQQTSRATG